MKKHTAKDFGYVGHEMLMNPATGSVDTAESWASQAHEWVDEDGDEFENFGYLFKEFHTLIEVEKDAEGDWVQ